MAGAPVQRRLRAAVPERQSSAQDNVRTGCARAPRVWAGLFLAQESEARRESPFRATRASNVLPGTSALLFLSPPADRGRFVKIIQNL